jgi:hypothetical protein
VIHLCGSGVVRQLNNVSVLIIVKLVVRHCHRDDLPLFLSGEVVVYSSLLDFAGHIRCSLIRLMLLVLPFPDEFVLPHVVLLSFDVDLCLPLTVLTTCVFLPMDGFRQAAASTSLRPIHR